MAAIKNRSGVADGVTAIGHELDTQTALVTSGAKLLSIKNAGVEKFSIDKDGNFTSASGVNGVWVVTPAEGTAGIQAAVNAAGMAGGGIVQLLKGTYTITATINTNASYTWPSPAPIVIQGLGDETVIDVQEGAVAFTLQGMLVNNVLCNPVSAGDTTIQITSPGSFYLGGYSKANDYLSIASDNGGPVYVYSVEPNQVLTDGDGINGIFYLKFPIQKATAGSTSTNVTVIRSRGYTLRNMSIIYSGTSDITGLVTLNTLGGLIENVTMDGGQNGKALVAIGVSQGARNLIRNCRFYNFGHDVGYDTLALNAEVETVVENCHFQHIRSARILCAGSGSTRCKFVNNTFFDVLNYALGTTAYGATDLHIEGNTVEKCKYTGVYIDGGSNITIVGNHIGNSGNGIVFQISEPGVIADNVITRCGYDTPGNGYGISVSGPAPNYARNVTISGNTVKDCATPGTGLYAAGSSITITNNTFQNAGPNAAMSVSGFNFTISNNSIMGSYYGMLFQLCKKMTITGNMIRASLVYGLYFSADGTERIEDVVVSNNFIDAGVDDALAAAIITANELRTDLMSHLGNPTRHPTGLQSSAGLVAATDLASLITLVTAELTMYKLHNDDAILGAGWLYHDTTATSQALASIVAPTTLAECYTRLIDMVAKYNAHEALATGHASLPSIVANQVSSILAAYNPTAYGIFFAPAAPAPVRAVITNNLFKDTQNNGIYAYVSDSIITSNWSPNANVIVGTGNVIGLNKE